MGAKNRVIAGDYMGKPITKALGSVMISVGLREPAVELDRSTVQNYEVVTEEQRKSAASGVARGMVGGALLGPVGLLAGGLSAKNKGTYQVVLQFKDGKRSLIEIDDKIYKQLVAKLF